MGVPPQYQVLMDKYDFFNNIQEQYGFDNRTIDIMENVYDKIKEKYGEKGQQYVDWMFFRALSQVGGYDDDDLSKKKDMVNPWKNGAGNAYKEKQHRDFFANNLGLNEDDFNYLKYNLRMEHQLSSNPSMFNSTCIDDLDDEKKMKWKQAMEIGLGLSNLTDKEMQSIINGMYDNFNGKGDFSHMCYTLSGNLNDEWSGVDNTWLALTDYGWWDKSTRKDIIGWLGDATICGDDGTVSFGNDDYIADLDADNIANRVNYKKGKTAMNAFNDYYGAMKNSNNYNEFRGKEFLQNNPYEKVEDTVLNHLGCFSYAELASKNDYSDAFKFLEQLKALQ